jgi:hypothetical protein
MNKTHRRKEQRRKEQRRKEQLGMPYGTASNKLRKALFFALLKANDLNICFRCGEVIDDKSELSIDHIEPWENSDKAAELFFDTGNVAYSHIRCNSRAGTAKLTNEDKREISASTLSAIMLAKRYNVDKSSIYRIRRTYGK